MAITFTYTESTNKVVHTEGISAAPARCAHFVTHDRTVATAACTIGSGAELKAATTIGADTDLTLTYPVRPVENKALRLAITTAIGDTDVSGDETIDIFGTTCVWHKLTGASASGQKVVPIANGTYNYQVGNTVILIDISAPATYETDTIASIVEGVSITMTNNNTNSYATGDIVGIYQTEQIDSSAAHATYWTTVPYGQIAMLTFTGYAGTNTGKVDQPIWGVIWDYGGGQYRIDANVDFGDADTSSYFESLDEMVYWAEGVQFRTLTEATLSTGKLYGDWGTQGSMWSIGATGATMHIVFGGTILIYASKLHHRTENWLNFETGTVDIKNSIMSAMYPITGGSAPWTRSYSFKETLTDCTLEDVYFVNVYSPFISISGTYSDIHSHYTYDGIAALYGEPVVSNFRATSYSQVAAAVNTEGKLTVHDPKSAISSVRVQVNGLWIKETYSINKHVANKNGDDLASASIDCEYAHLVEGSDSKTYKCIQNHTAVDATHKPITGTDWADYWELYDAGGGLGGDWTTSFDYKSATTEFSTQTTDANGDITEQTAQINAWTTTSELKETRLHKFTLSKGGYETLPLDDITVDAPIVWHLELQPIRCRALGRSRRMQISNFE